METTKKEISENAYEGFTMADHNTFRYWLAVMEYGKQTLLCIFNWAYKKPKNQLKQQILERVSIKQYRQDFDTVQRNKIENEDISQFDISLLYLLLQRVCGLPKPSDLVWSQFNPENALPNLLYNIKLNRNNLVHSKVSLTYEEMVNKLTGLQTLFTQALQEAGVYLGIPEELVERQMTRISNQLQALKSTNVDKVVLSDLLQATTKEQADIARNEARCELKSWYSQVCKVSLDEHELRQCNIEDIFTEPLLKHENESIILNDVADDGIVDVKNIFQARTPCGQRPSIILIVSNPGFGKTTLVKFILHSWVTENSLVEDLDNFEVIFYVDLRTSHADNLDEYLKEILPKTSSIFGVDYLKRYLLLMRVLFILDNVDCIKDAKKTLLDEILRFNSSSIQCLATSTENISKSVNSRSPLKKSTLPIHLKGMHGIKIKQCIDRFYNSSRLQSPEIEVHLQSFCADYLHNANPTHAAFHSPEVLSHTFSQWLCHTDSSKSYVTKTNLYFTNLSLLKTRLYAQISPMQIYEKMVFHKKVEQLFEKIGEIALENLQTSPLVNFHCFDQLIDLATELKMPLEVILPSIFSVHDDQRMNLHSKMTVTFQSNSLQLFHCALALVRLLQKQLPWQLKLETVTKSNMETIIKFVLGLMTSTHLQVSNTEITEVLTYLEKCDTSSNFFLELWEECNGNEQVKVTIHKLLGENWKIQDLSRHSSLTSLFCDNLPVVLTLTFTDLHCCSNIVPVLRACPPIRNLQLHLHIFCHSWMKNDYSSDEYITVIKEKSLHLQSFAGKITTSAYSLLPTTLQSLALQLTIEDIESLNKTLPALKELKMLYLIFHLNGNELTSKYPSIRVPNRTTNFSVDIWDANINDIDGLCTIISKICKAYCRLVLRKTKFKYEHAETWLKGLRHHRIHADSLVIGSVHSLSSNQKNLLCEEASSFECSQFKWIEVKPT